MAIVTSAKVDRPSLVQVLPIRQHLLPGQSYHGHELHAAPTLNYPTQPEPLAPFTSIFHQRTFGPPSNLDSEDHVPPPPDTFEGTYLPPTLTEFEHSRLMLVWYYTRDIQHDAELLSRLSHMVEIIKTSLGWEIGIVGLSEAEHYIRVVAKNVPAVTIPRKDSVCSHTINRPPGTVLSLLDLPNDWRMAGLPPVAQGGLKSYAGTPMTLPMQDGQRVPWGSLCVASLQQREPLSAEQKETLIRASEVITGEIVARKRLQRAQEKQSMLEKLAALSMKAHAESVDAAVMAELQARYPECTPMIVPINDGKFALSSGKNISLDSIQDGIWEDSGLINTVIESGAFQRAINGRTIRVVSAHITPSERAVILATSELKCVFDDLDVWFVDQCAQIINTSAQARLLREAFTAKNTFLRSITHELRTPIHAILSSVELAKEEIRARSQPASDSVDRTDASFLNPFLETVRRSGTDLMTTVNNILRLNAFVSDMKCSPSDYDLRLLEAHVLEEVFGGYTEGQMPALSIRFESTVPDSDAFVRVDGDLLKELLKYLITNAISATPSGSVVVTTSIEAEDRSIVIDVVDTGVGIADADKDRIFQSFEKVDVHSPGAGLGLSLATQTAATLNGKVTLISSKPNKGSHFRVQIPHIIAKINYPPRRGRTLKSRHLPSSYHVVLHSKRSMHLVKHLERYLQYRNLAKSDSAQGSIIVTNQPKLFHSHCTKLARSLEGPHTILYVCDEPMTAALRDCAASDFPGHLVQPVYGPLFSSRLEEMLSEADAAFAPYRTKNVSRPHLETVSRKNSDLVASPMDVATPPMTPSVDFVKSMFTAVPVKPAIKALLVDDNSVNLSVLQMYCKRRKIPYGTAINGNQAISQYCQNADPASKEMVPYTVIFMDLQMPECDGIQASRRIREYEQEHKLQRSIILILTGQDSVTDKTNAFQAGVDDYYTKPVSMKKLDQAIAQYFSTSPSWE